MAGWKTLSSEDVYETPWIKVRRDQVLNHAGKELTYSVVELHHPSVFIVATNEKQKILLQRAYRYTIDQEIWEIPAGHSDGQDLLQAAKRELLEETGYVSEDWQSLGQAWQGIGIGNLPIAYFWAKHVHKQQDSKEDTEDISGHTFMSLSEIDTLIKTNQFQDVPVITALYLAKVHGLT